jgi:3'(2'), 5'-bisphosphate nucleotidase
VAGGGGATAPRLAVSRTRPGWPAGVIRERLGGELVPLGSAGFKALAVVRGAADVYAHSGGQYEWDSAAPVAVALAHGLHASRLDGSPLVYNNPSPYLPDLLIAHPDWARPALQAVADGEPQPTHHRADRT